MRLIDADALAANKFKNDISYNSFCNLVKRQPTIDAVQVVRCKDCRFFKSWDNGYYGRCKTGLAVTAGMFCSCGSRADGERKDDEQ